MKKANELRPGMVVKSKSSQPRSFRKLMHSKAIDGKIVLEQCNERIALSFEEQLTVWAKPDDEFEVEQ